MLVAFPVAFFVYTALLLFFHLYLILRHKEILGLYLPTIGESGLRRRRRKKYEDKLTHARHFNFLRISAD